MYVVGKIFIRGPMNRLFKVYLPLLAAVSYRDPVSIHNPTVAVGTPLSSVATRMPLSSTEISVGGRFRFTLATAL